MAMYSDRYLNNRTLQDTHKLNLWTSWQWQQKPSKPQRNDYRRNERETAIIIGASLSEPHTYVKSGDFVYINFIYVWYVPIYIYVWYVADATHCMSGISLEIDHDQLLIQSLWMLLMQRACLTLTELELNKNTRVSLDIPTGVLKYWVYRRLE